MQDITSPLLASMISMLTFGDPKAAERAMAQTPPAIQVRLNAPACAFAFWSDPTDSFATD